MTGRQAASSKPRLARKGQAVPAGLADRPGLAESDGASSARPGAGPGAEMDPEASTGTSAPPPTFEAAPIPNPEAAPAVAAETAPAASLLPFEYLGARGPSFDPARLPRAEPEVRLDPPAAPPAEPPAGAAARPEAAAAPANSATSAKAEPPRVDPAWRLGHDPKPARPALAAALAVATVLGLGWHAHRAGWLDFEARIVERVEAPSETAAKEAPTRGVPGQDAPGATPSVPEKTVGTAATSVPRSAPTSAAAPALAPAAAATKAPATAPSDEGADAGRAPEPTPPSVDVVRVEPDGAAVIAGRAAPGAGLIVLHNGAPIGTATADAFGEWVFIPDAPLPAGAHEFGLVVKRVQGGVTLPAAGRDGPAGNAPAPREVERETAERAEVERGPTGNEREPTAHAPVPAPKPAAGAAAQGNGGGVPRGASGADFPGADFVVQLASAKTRAGAEREWRALRRRFPKLLADMRLSLDEAKLAGDVTVVRLRTGAFPDARAAAALCARLEAKRQDCLVVRAAAGG